MKLVVSSASPNTVKSSTASSCTYGTHYPNRIFAGYLPGKVTASDLADFFRLYGTVLEGKIVLDSLGRSRRFGFITFASPEDVKNVLSRGSIFYNGKKINVGPAIKKMSPDDMTPPQSPNGVEKVSKIPTISSSMDSLHERIVTVPPVNEKTTSNPEGKKSGNVWLKINSEAKPKHEELPEIRTSMQPIAYQAYNLHPGPYPTCFNGPSTYPRIYLHNQSFATNQSLLQIMPYHPRYFHPVLNVGGPIVS